MTISQLKEIESRQAYLVRSMTGKLASMRKWIESQKRKKIK